MKTIKFRKLNDLAKTPFRANLTDAGSDLFSTEKVSIPPLSRKMIKTGICLEIPEGFYGRVAPRSGLAFKKGIDVLAGVIDSSYRGELCVILYNTDQNDSFDIDIGDRIAQLIIESHYNFEFENTDELSSTNRDTGGFGSSGTN